MPTLTPTLTQVGENPHWPDESVTEIVSLRSGGREGHSIDTILPHLRCGAPPELRACDRSEPAIRMHTMCARPPVWYRTLLTTGDTKRCAKIV